jgi:cellulose synthase/poly-beta-1,6-N-acetylglucosamine synthase-like glycosyltransferase
MRAQSPARLTEGGRCRTWTFTAVVSLTLISVSAVGLIAWLLSRSPTSRWDSILSGAPPLTIIVAAAVSVLAIMWAGVIIEALSLLPQVRPPQQRIFAANPAGPARVTVIIPAHNEQATLPDTLSSLREQVFTVDRIVVVADNCSDLTADVARQAGCAVLETQGNTGRKAGALNQALARLLPASDQRDLFLIMDADTHLTPGFIASAAQLLDSDGEVAAVGGVFAGDSRPGMLAQLQRNEFARYARQISARRGRVFVLTGTATLFRATALELVATHRGGFLPGTRGKVYEESAITEDNELTLALKALGAHVVSPRECSVRTETMPTLSTLWTQRLRWQRGALDNLSDYGVRAATTRYWIQQWGLAYGSIALPTSLVALFAVPIIVGQWALLPFWVAVTAMFSLERGLTAWDTGWRGRLLAFSLVPEIVYDLFLQACFVRALSGMVTSRDLEWGHLNATLEEART